MPLLQQGRQTKRTDCSRAKPVSTFEAGVGDHRPRRGDDCGDRQGASAHRPLKKQPSNTIRGTTSESRWGATLASCHRKNRISAWAQQERVRLSLSPSVTHSVTHSLTFTPRLTLTLTLTRNSHSTYIVEVCLARARVHCRQPFSQARCHPKKPGHRKSPK